MFLNGGIPAGGANTAAGQGTNPRDIDPLALLRNSGINTDLIPASMLPTIASSLAMNTDESNDNAKIKVDCAACNRQVAYGRGKCMYCGKPLELPLAAGGQGEADAAGEAPARESETATTSTGIDFDLGGSL